MDIGFFGLCSIIFLWMMFVPQRLRLDPEGFTLSGGLVFKPKTISWRDIERFYVYRAGTASLIGFDYNANTKASWLARFMGEHFGVQAGLPYSGRQSSEQMVEILNGYRVAALIGSGRRPDDSPTS